MTDSTVTGNSAGGRGGGIDGHPQRYSAGMVMVANSTVSGNTSIGDGGGINGGRVTMINSTVSGNRAGPDESGSSDYSSGGGISAGTVTLTSSTVTGNYAASYYTGGDGGGGIRSSAMTLADSIVAGNAERDGVGDDVAGTIASSNGHNIFGSDVAGAIVGDLQGVAPSLLFASLDPDTGGGQLNAAGIVPLRNSVTNPALSGGDPLAALPTDQLGTARPLPAGSLPDIGAAERNQALSTTRLAQQRRADRHGRRQHDRGQGRRRPDQGPRRQRHAARRGRQRRARRRRRATTCSKAAKGSTSPASAAARPWRSTSSPAPPSAAARPTR